MTNYFLNSVAHEFLCGKGGKFNRWEVRVSSQKREVFTAGHCLLEKTSDILKVVPPVYGYNKTSVAMINTVLHFAGLDMELTKGGNGWRLQTRGGTELFDGCNRSWFSIDLSIWMVARHYL